MSLPYGDDVSVVLTAARLDLMDNSGAPRWGDSQLLQYFNDGVREMATANIFRRIDVITPAANQVFFQTFMEPVNIFGAWYDGRRLAAQDEFGLERQYGINWSTIVGLQISYVFKRFLRLAPLPGTQGAALTAAGSPSITEAEGRGPGGHRYWCFDNSGTLHHFLPGDGSVGNSYARQNLWVEYAYYPDALLATDTVDKRYSLALRDFIVWKCLYRSDDKAEVAQAQASIAKFEDFKRQQTVLESRPSAEMLPNYPMDVNGWENKGIGGVPRILAGY